MPKPPKISNLHHVTFHFYKSAVLLSVPSNTSIKTLKETLISALQPLSNTLSSSSLTNPIISPADLTPADIQLWESKAVVEGQEGQGSIRNIEEGDSGVGSRSVNALGWGRWKSVFVSFKNADGTFGEPVYTVPDVEDEEPDGSEA
ncbi:hypothetical protein I317_04850 [Kwoniella heveanensis CBS 569]|nr:hypothetical protein I317_04850 [Kwoniella heveanensis CBS 569]